MAEFNRFEGLDGGEFEVRTDGSFVWERDATERMVEGAGKPSRAGVPGFSVRSLRSKHFAEIPVDSVAPKKTGRPGFPDLHEASEVMDLTGGVDAGERLGGLSDSTEIAEHIGLRVDAVGVVGVGPKGGFRNVGHAEVVSELEAVEMERWALGLKLARADRAERLREKGKGGRSAENVVNVDVGIFNMELVRARKIMGLDARGRVRPRKEAGFDESAAGM